MKKTKDNDFSVEYASTSDTVSAQQSETENEENFDIVISKKQSLSSTNVAQLISHALFNIISIFVSTFLVSYIYSISDNYLVSIGSFYAMHYLVMGIMYLAVSAVIDRTNRVFFYRVALVIKAGFILMIIFIGQKLAGLVLLAGALSGLSEACYWTSYNIMKNELVRKRAMKKYATLQSGIEKFLNFIIPISLGKIIDANSFKTSAIIACVVVCIQLISSFFIKSHRPENSSFDMKDFCKQVRALGDKKGVVTNSFTVAFVYGLHTSIAYINTIVIMLVFNSNFSLGILKGVFSLLAIVFLVYLNKSRPGKKSIMYILCGTLPVISAVLCAIFTNKTFVIIFTMLITICQLSYTYSFDVCRNVVLKKLKMYDCIAEYQCTIELTLEIARVIIFSIMIVFGVVGASFGSEGLILSAKIFLALSTSVMLVVNILMMRYENKLVKNGIL